MGNIFDLSGPDFLEFYFFLTLGALMLGAFLRWYVRFPGGMPAPTPRLSPLEVAALSGSDKGVAYAALAGMVYSRVLEPKPGLGRMRRVGELLADSDPLENIIFENCTAIGTRPGDIRDCVKPYTREIRSRLNELELVMTDGHRALATIIPMLVMAIVIIIGLIKINVGIARNRPVEILCFYSIVNVVLTAAIFARPPLRTRRGDALLRFIRSSQPALKASVQTRGSKLKRNDIVLAFALFGSAVVASADTELQDLNDLLNPPRPSGGGDRFFSGGGCGGGAGCGGGGGGGCGGCGGGGGH